MVLFEDDSRRFDYREVVRLAAHQADAPGLKAHIFPTDDARVPFQVRLSSGEAALATDDVARFDAARVEFLWTHLALPYVDGDVISAAGR